MNTAKTCSRTSGRSRNKILNQTILFISADPALAHDQYHNAFLDYPGQPLLSFQSVNGVADTIGGLLDNVVFKESVDGDHDGNHIMGTAVHDYLVGTDGNGHIQAGDGNETLVCGKGSDFLEVSPAIIIRPITTVRQATTSSQKMLMEPSKWSTPLMALTRC